MIIKKLLRPEIRNNTDHINSLLLIIGGLASTAYLLQIVVIYFRSLQRQELTPEEFARRTASTRFQ